MRLLSASVKNYRIHREVEVTFDDALTLVGGPNESGKSTLVEAIHRALFLKATITGEAQKGMQSRDGGHPEVEVAFAIGDASYRIHKLFGGQSGKATLTETGGASHHGAEAETRLAELLGVEEVGGGRGAANRAAEQWAHLWVWQGKGGEDPSSHTASQRDALLSRLEDQGGGAAMQSERDARVAARFQEACDAIFTQNGSPKAGSDLKRAVDDREAAAEALGAAENAFRQLEDAVRDFEEAERTLVRWDGEKEKLAKELDAARRKREVAAELRNRIELDEEKLQRVRERHEQWRKALEELRTLRARIDELTESARPDSEALTRLEAEANDRLAERDRATTAVKETETELAAARARETLAEHWLACLKQREEKAKLEKRLEEIRRLREKRNGVEDGLARLPAVDDDTFARLQRLDAECSEAEAVLRATSTGIGVIRSPGPVRVGDRTREKGEELVIDRETRVEAGDDLALTITPGGGGSLEEARDEADRLRAARREAFDEAGVETVAEAGEIRGKRQSLESERRELEAELTGRNPDEVEANLETVARELGGHEAEIERRSPQVADFSPPADVDAARELHSEAERRVEALEAKMEEAKRHHAAAGDTAERAREEWSRKKEAAQATEHQLIELRARLAGEEERLGSEDERRREADERKTERERAESELAARRKELEALQPDAVEADIDRLERALQHGESEVERAREKRTAARTLLTRDGAVDPAGALAAARARSEAAAERHRSLDRRARALQLLRDRFLEEQQKLSDRFSRPLADAVSTYLRQIFGPTADAAVSIDEGVIGGWTLTRDGRTFDFAQLSGGAREQVAAAVRLAVAEILAPDHGGSLPVVFDDAFTHSDPERVRSLQRMLDLAARNGLQVILLTCNPEDYTGLGAEVVRLG